MSRLTRRGSANRPCRPREHDSPISVTIVKQQEFPVAGRRGTLLLQAECASNPSPSVSAEVGQVRLRAGAVVFGRLR